MKDMKKAKQPEVNRARVKADQPPPPQPQPKSVAADKEEEEDAGEQQTGRKSYRKREVVSNWDRYDAFDPAISSDQEDATVTGPAKKVSTNFNLDFNELLRDSYDVSRGVIKTDRALGDSDDKLGDFLLLDKLKLERAFNCLSLAESANYNGDLFGADEVVETADFFDAEDLTLLDEETRRAIDDFNRIYNKPTSAAAGPKFIEIQDEFDFLKDLSLKERPSALENEPAVNNQQATEDEKKKEVSVVEPASGNDWLDDLLN